MKKVFLILVFLPIFGAGFAQWEFSGKASIEATLFDTQNGSTSENSYFSADKNNTWFVLGASRKFLDFNVFNFTINTDDEDDQNGNGKDSEFEISVVSKPNKIVEVGVGGYLSSKSDDDLKVENSNNDLVYVRFNKLFNETFSIGFYPFEVCTGIGNEFQSTGTLENPGLNIEYIPIDEIRFALTLNSKNYVSDKSVELDGEYQRKAIFGMMSELSYKDEFFFFLTQYYMDTQGDQSDKVFTNPDNADAINPLKAALSVQSALTYGRFTFSSELYLSKLNKAFLWNNSEDEVRSYTIEERDISEKELTKTSGMAVYAKIEADLGELGVFEKSSVYTSGKMFGEYLYDDGDGVQFSEKTTQDLEAMGVNETLLTGNYIPGGHAYNQYSVGLNLGIKGVLINPELSFLMAENKIFEDGDKTTLVDEVTKQAYTNTAIEAKTTVSYQF